MALLAWAWCVDLSASSVENQHALNRSLEGLACENVVSGYVNRESLTVKLCREFVGPTPDLDPADADLATNPADAHISPLEATLAKRERTAELKEANKGGEGAERLCRRGLTYTVSLDFRLPTL